MARYKITYISSETQALNRQRERLVRRSERSATSQSTKRPVRRRRGRNSINNDHIINKFRQQVDADRFYVVEKLLEKRFTNNGTEEYLVRWQNYPPDWDSWEPRSELEMNCRTMINEFNRISDTASPDNERPLCICKQTYNTNRGGMIQCFNCLQWFHFKCIEMNMEEANSYAIYNCQDCRKANPNLKSTIKREKLNAFQATTSDESSR